MAGGRVSEAPIVPRKPTPIADVIENGTRNRMDEVRKAIEVGRTMFDREPEPLPEPATVLRKSYVQRPYVPGRFRGATFDNFDPMISGAEHAKELSLAKRAAERFAAAALARKPAVFALVGKPGNGKSHLLYAVANALAAYEAPVFCRAWYRLADELRFGGPLPWHAAEDRAPRAEPWQLREALYRAQIVLLDEVRGTAGTDFDGNELAKIACHANDEGIALMITSNVYPLELIMGAAPADRFAVVQLAAPSKRADL